MVVDPGHTDSRAWLALLALFAAYFAGLVYSSRLATEVVPRSAPSSLNADAVGSKALFLLCGRLGYSSDRLETDWRALAPRDGLLVALEPFAADRQPAAVERTALMAWLQQGGSILYGVAPPARSGVSADPIFDQLDVVPAPDVRCEESILPAIPKFIANVQSVQIQSPIRFRPHSPAYTALLQDKYGVTLAYRRLGSGSVLLLADSLMPSNSRLANADNAVLLANIVANSINMARPVVNFDEYHHGAGLPGGNIESTDDSLWSAMPIPLRLVMLQLLAVLVVVIYNSNRRFGQALAAPHPPTPAKSQLLTAIAGVMRSANAGDLAVDLLYRNFRSETARQLNIAPTSETALLLAVLDRYIGQDRGDLGTLMARCDQILQGERVSEEEAVSLALRIDQWQRRLERVGVSGPVR